VSQQNQRIWQCIELPSPSGNCYSCDRLLHDLPPEKNSFMLLSTRGHKVQYHNTTTYFRCTTCQQHFVLSHLLWSLYSLSQVSRLLYKKISPSASVGIHVYLQVTQFGDCLKYIYFHKKKFMSAKEPG